MSFVPRTLAELELDFPTEIRHVSASSLKMLVRCEEQWRQRYILKKIEPPSLKMIGGGADHKAIELSMTQKIDTHVDLPVGEVRDLFVHELETRVQKEGGLGEIEIPDAETPQARTRAFDELRTHGQLVVAKYHTEVSPVIQPVLVEEEFRLPVAGSPVELLGYIDLVHGDESGPITVIDRKRVAQNRKQVQPEWRLQSEVYQLALPYPFIWHLSVTTKEPKIIVPTTMDDELVLPVQNEVRVRRMVEMLVSKLGFLYQRYGPDEPWPATGKMHTWACKMCGYRNGCWGWET